MSEFLEKEKTFLGLNANLEGSIQNLQHKNIHSIEDIEIPDSVYSIDVSENPLKSLKGCPKFYNSLRALNCELEDLAYVLTDESPEAFLIDIEGNKNISIDSILNQVDFDMFLRNIWKISDVNIDNIEVSRFLKFLQKLSIKIKNNTDYIINKENVKRLWRISKSLRL